MEEEQYILNDEWATEEIKIWKFPELNENKSTVHQKLQNTMETLLGETFVAVSTYAKISKRFQNKQPKIYLKSWKNKNKPNLKAVKGKK